MRGRVAFGVRRPTVGAPKKYKIKPWEGGAEASGATAWGLWKKFRDTKEVYVIARFCKNPPVRKRYNTSND